MKKLFLLSLLFLLGCSKTMRMPKTDNNKYVLSIKETALVTEKDIAYYTVPVTLTNTSKDTLNYYNMSCSWQDLYTADNSNVFIASAQCAKNIPKWLTISPGKSETVLLKLTLKKPLETKPISFKVGFNLIKLNKKIWEEIMVDDPTIKNYIWSNEITVSK